MLLGTSVSYVLQKILENL